MPEQLVAHGAADDVGVEPEPAHVVLDLPLQLRLCAIASISTSAPEGSAEISTVERAGRLLADVPRVDLVHPLEVAEVGEEDGRLHDPVETAAGLLENRLQVPEDLLRLLLDRRPRSPCRRA